MTFKDESSQSFLFFIFFSKSSREWKRMRDTIWECFYFSKDSKSFETNSWFASKLSFPLIKWAEKNLSLFWQHTQKFKLFEYEWGECFECKLECWKVFNLPWYFCEISFFSCVSFFENLTYKSIVYNTQSYTIPTFFSILYFHFLLLREIQILQIESWSISLLLLRLISEIS